ncbi:MAG: serine/threonine-protein phosphatase [Ruminococcus sp.]|nr:serine/threonine-protein phosphatase [Ruminococcus sp.]
MNFLISAVSDIGIKRQTNQDSLSAKIVDTFYGQVMFAIICDGMGGLSKGELASATIIRAFDNWFYNDLIKILHNNKKDIKEDLKRSWESIILEQNDKLKEYGEKNQLQLGSTLTTLLCHNNRYYIVHVGDTRVYQLTESIVQLTKDQTLLQKEIDSGNLTTPQQIEDFPKKSVLLQCVGVADSVMPYFYSGKIDSNMVFLLCSDGFRHKISNEEMFNNLNYNNLTDEMTMNNILLNLTEMDKNRLEKDNISSIAIKVTI